MSDNQPLWRAKLAAWLHDPAEKAIVLMRDPGVRHESVTEPLRQKLFAPGLTDAEKELVKRADWWAAAADRPNFPKSVRERVVFANYPELIHPLTGAPLAPRPFGDISVAAIKEVSAAHFSSLIHGGDLRRTHLAFWRFGPDTPARDLNGLWGLMPADTRVPDHTIWSHLDLVSALTGAFAADPQHEAALLTVSLGPVQDFIASARKGSDLWAGSHLLSRLAWEAMRVICDELGPDSIIFPKLRGIPLADLWLRNDCELNADLFTKLPCFQRESDTNNPLFAASLPNKFLAVVPACRARALGEAVAEQVRAWALDQCSAAATSWAETSGAEVAALLEQCRAQLAGFPEVHWAAVPWSLAERSPDAGALGAAAAPFTGPDGLPFLRSTAWGLLSERIEVEGEEFFKPNPGVLYPALHDLSERLLAASKSLRAFEPLDQTGLRCKLCGERTALGGKDAKAGQYLWDDIARHRPSWAKANECLCAPCWWKRNWSRQFSAWAREQTGLTNLAPYYVSTHTMALATTFGRLQKENENGRLDAAKLRRLRDSLAGYDAVALPASLLKAGGDLGEVFRRLPDALDRETEGDERAAAAIAGIRDRFAGLAGEAPENYYALIQMDGDGMGEWLSGARKDGVTLGQVWHSRIRNCTGEIAAGRKSLQDYLDEHRPASPGQHAAISEALHAFSAVLAPVIVEHMFKGKLIYAGGDDLLALVSVDDLLPCLAALRALYRGDEIEPAFPGLTTGNGFAFWRRRLYRLMGNKATCSAGAVVAHFTQPLSYVLRELRAAETAAKSAGKDAFSIRLLKRSGGDTHLTLPYATGEHFTLADLERARSTFARKGVSRRAAYHVLEQLPLLPSPELRAMLAPILDYQLHRQGGKNGEGAAMAERILAAHKEIAAREIDQPPKLSDLARDFLTVAEFLARNGRQPQVELVEQAQEANA